jgi:hypothetical protein
MSANASLTSVRRHSTNVRFVQRRTRPGPAPGSTRQRSCWLTRPLEMLAQTNATREPTNGNVPQASRRSCIQKPTNMVRRSRLDVRPPSTGPRRSPTGRHRPTTDRSSATADGPLGFADLRTTPGMSEHNAGSTSRDAPPAFERSGQPSRPGGPVISPYGAGGWLRSLKLGPPAASGSFRESGLRDL